VYLELVSGLALDLSGYARRQLELVAGPSLAAQHVAVSELHLTAAIAACILPQLAVLVAVAVRYC
jgi:hypothetical protein